MERRQELPETVIPETNVEGRDRRTPVGKRRESGERAVEKGHEPPRYFDVKDFASGTPDFAVRTDPETGLVVFVDGRDAPREATAHIANGIFAEARLELPMLTTIEAVSGDDNGAEIFRPRRNQAESLLASASENALAEGDLILQNAELIAHGDRETALELPASAVLAVIPEHITEEEIIGADKDMAETLVNQKTLTADEKTWKEFVESFQESADEQKKRYEASLKRITPLLERASQYLKGGAKAKALEGEDDVVTWLRRGAADVLARFDDEPGPDPLTVKRQERRRDLLARRRGRIGIWDRIIAMPIFSTAERKAFQEHKNVLFDAGSVERTRRELETQRDEQTSVRTLFHELRSAPQDAERRLQQVLDTGEPRLASDERMLLAEVLSKDKIIRDPRLLARLREPDLDPEERATVGALEDVLRERQEPVAAVMALDEFRGLSRAARFTLAERLKEHLPEPQRLRLLETRAVSISGRLGNDILVYRLRNGRLEPLHDAMNRRGQETLKLRGFDRPVRANQTARESFAAEFGDEFVLLPAEHAQLRADATLAASKDPEGTLRQLVTEERYPMVRITVRPPQEPASAISPALDTEAQTG